VGRTNNLKTDYQHKKGPAICRAFFLNKWGRIGPISAAGAQR
jgi:hypothetical protein